VPKNTYTSVAPYQYVVVRSVEIVEANAPTHGACSSPMYSVEPSSDAAPRGRYAALLVVYFVDVSTQPLGAMRATTRAVAPLRPHGTSA